MIKIAVFVSLFTLSIGSAFAQTATDSIPKFDPKVKNALNMVDQMAYQAGLRYSDLSIAKIKLYDLMARNPEDLRYMEALGSLYFEAGEYASSALVAMDILKINDKNVGALEIASYALEQLGAFDRAERLVDLVTAVVDGAELAGLSLFAGWQSQARVSDPLGRCYQLLNVLRELRGSVHITAVVAHGVTPLQALLANPNNNGSETAERFGWSGPYQDVKHLRDDFMAAENLTNVLMAQHLSVLTTVEQNELLELVTEVHSILFP